MASMIRPTGAYSTRLAWARTAASNSRSSFTPIPMRYLSRYFTTWSDNTSNNRPITAANTAVTGTIMSALLDLVDHSQQQHSTHRGCHQLTDHALYRQAQHAEQHTADHRADNTDTDIGQYAEAFALHDQARQPAGQATDNQKPEKAHLSTPLMWCSILTEDCPVLGRHSSSSGAVAEGCDGVCDLLVTAGDQLGHIGTGQAGGFYRRQDMYWHGFPAAGPATGLAVVLAGTHHGDGGPGGNGRVDSAFSEAPQPPATAAGAFRKHPDAFAVFVNSITGSLHGCNGFMGAAAIEDDVAAEPEHLAKERNPHQRRFAHRHGARRQQVAHHKQVVVLLVVGGDYCMPVLRHVFGAIQGALHAQQAAAHPGYGPTQQTVVIGVEGPCDVANQGQHAHQRNTQPGQYFSCDCHTALPLLEILAHKCTPQSEGGNSILLYRSVNRLCLHYETQRAVGIERIKRVTGYQQQGIRAEGAGIDGLCSAVHHPGAGDLVLLPLLILAL